MNVEELAHTLKKIASTTAFQDEVQGVKSDLYGLAQSLKVGDRVSMEELQNLLSVLDVLRDEVDDSKELRTIADEAHEAVTNRVETRHKLLEIGEKTVSSSLTGSRTVVETSFNPYTQYKTQRINEDLATKIVNQELVQPVLNKAHKAMCEVLQATTFLVTHPSAKVRCEIVIEESFSGFLLPSSTDDLVKLGLKLSERSIKRIANDDKPLTTDQYKVLVHELTHHFDDVYNREETEQGVLGYLQLMRDEAIPQFAEEAMTERAFLRTIESVESTLKEKESTLPKVLDRYGPNYREGCYELAEASSHLLYRHYLQKNNLKDNEQNRKQFIKKLRMYDVHQYWEAYKEARHDLDLEEDRLSELYDAYKLLHESA